MRQVALILFFLCGCAATPPAPDLNPAHALTLTRQSSAQPATEILPAPSATITLLPSASVELDWTPPLDADNYTYNVYVGTESGVYSNVLNVAVASAIVTNLAPLQTYFFAVTAVNADGVESDYSSELPVSTPQWVRLHFPEPNITGIQSSPDLAHWVDRPDAVQTNGDWLLRAKPEISTN